MDKIVETIAEILKSPAEQENHCSPAEIAAIAYIEHLNSKKSRGKPDWKATVWASKGYSDPEVEGYEKHLN